jgi:hypothetical protein
VGDLTVIHSHSGAIKRLLANYEWLSDVIFSFLRGQAMDMTADAWRILFENWPQSIDRKGMIFSKQNENIPFIDFLITNSLVLIDRGTPDAHGARKVVLALDQIAAIKLAGNQPMSDFQSMGFQAPFG